jgi:sugar-specific transcriptional regulator TrmB
MEQELMSLGLTWNEVKVYMSLMRLGETQVGGIINDLKVHRQIAYNALDALEKRGMVQKTMKNGIAHFKVSDPDVIVEDLQKKELMAKRLSETIKKEMKKINREHQINIYNGREGARRYFLQEFKKLPVGGTSYVMNATSERHVEILGEDFIRGPYNKIRNERQIHTVHIMSEKNRSDDDKYIKKTNPHLRDRKFLPYENMNPVATLIWNESVGFMSIKDDIFIIEIIDKNFRDSYKEHFDMLWNIAKE